MNRRLSIFLLFLGAYLLSYFFRSANAVIAPNLTRELGLDASQLGLMTSLFFASFALVQLPLGSALDRFGPRWVTPGLMLFGVAGSWLFATAESFATLAAGRALLGLGMAGILMGGLKIFASWFPPRRFATVSSLLVGLGSAGALFAGTPMAWLSERLGWRAVFGWGALVILVSAVAIVLWTRNAPDGVSWRSRPSNGNESFTTVFRDVRLWKIALLNFYIVGTVLAFQGLWSGPYLYDVYGLNELAVGNLLLVLALGVVVGNMLSGGIADAVGRTPVIVTCGAVFTGCQVLLALTLPALPQLALGALYLLFGLSGTFGVVLFAHARSIFPPSMTGRAVAAVNLFGIGGAMLLQWAMGMIIEAGSTVAGDPRADAAAASAAYGPEAYGPAFVLTAMLGVATLSFYLSSSFTRQGGMSAHGPGGTTNVDDAT